MRPRFNRFVLPRDRTGAEPTQFLSVVGNWIVTEDSGRKVLLVDRREWKAGQASGGLATPRQ